MLTCMAESLSLQATIASDLLEKVQTEGTVMLSRDEIEPFFTIGCIICWCEP